MTQPDLHNTFSGLIKAHERIIFKICYLYADNQADRQDLYQEIVIQVWKGYQRFRGEAKFSTWLYQVAINTAITGLRKEKKFPVILRAEGTLPEPGDAGSTDPQTAQLEALYLAIGKLNETEKALVLLYLDGRSYEDMESIMGIPNGALRVKMTRIKEKLRQLTKHA